MFPRTKPTEPDTMPTMNNGQGGPSATRTPAPRAGYGTPADPRNPQPQEKPRRHGGHLFLYALILIMVLGAIFAFVTVRKSHQSEELKQATQTMAVPTVLVVHPEPGSGEVHLTLPGAVQAYMESSVYAQISGYIKRWLVDIGAPVKKGQLLAEIEAPVIEQQLLQSQANLGQTQANLDLAQVTAARYDDLLTKHAVAQQDADNQNANVAVQKANVAAAQAGVSSIQNALAFKQVVAPFDGVVTARRVDVGDFVTSGGGTSSSSGTSGAGTTPAAGNSTELFRVAQTQVLRVYVTVPESNSAEVVPGVTANISLASNPNENVKGTLVRTSKSIDPTSLTLLAEVDIDNADGKLLPGGYAQVHFDLKESNPPLLIPGNALLFRAQGPQVGVVDGDGKVQLKDITIGRDFGTKLEVIHGIDANDQVIVNPSDSLTTGLKVQIKKEDTPAAPPRA
jgi:multidrug efflux pump subunit AcrA (membrane-fusion protein)